ncbi:MAG: hypothetical protein K6D02_03390, partial [Lachnospiraceae bacterium]|nr:hypothetical protein [Lachnospiraceae bacterium]
YNVSEDELLREKISPEVKKIMQRLWFGKEEDKDFSDMDISNVKSDIIRLQEDIWTDKKLKDKFVLKYIKHITFPLK